MSSEPIKMKQVTLKEAETGKNMIIQTLPEGWKSTVTTYRDRYRGRGQPFLVTTKTLSPDGRTAIFYNSGLHYRDDHLESHKDYSTDLYGILYRKILTTEKYLEARVPQDLKGVTNLRLVKQSDWSGNAKKQEELRQKKEKEYGDDPNTVIDRVYRKGIVQEYAFERDGYPRRRFYSCLLEATEIAIWRDIPYLIAANLNNPFMADISQLALQAYPYARYDKQLRKWIYTLSYYVDWTVRQILIMDVPEKESQQMYSSVFLPAVNAGTGYADDLLKERDEMQQARDKKNQAKRDELSRERDAKRAEEKRARDAEEARRERDRQTREKLRQTQKEIEEIRRSAYENTQKTQAKVREMWGDTIRGDTRFVDKYGDEHVIHTYDNYAYKSGSTYVTSDSPLDHGWDWEELEKKKY